MPENQLRPRVCHKLLSVAIGARSDWSGTAHGDGQTVFDGGRLYIGPRRWVCGFSR